jgi:hypothetical protein
MVTLQLAEGDSPRFYPASRMIAAARCKLSSA